jgi:hypothetical protein
VDSEDGSPVDVEDKMRQRFEAVELANLLANAHGIEVRLWIVNDGVFEGIVFDSKTSNEQWKLLIADSEEVIGE